MSNLTIGIDASDIKRLPLSSEIKVTCPECGNISIFTKENNDYFSYPKIGSTLDFYCDECDHKWSPYKFKAITVELEKNE